MMVPAHAVRQSVMEPAMDAIVLNAEQARLLSNPDTSACDSIEEIICLIDGAMHQLHALVRKLADANGVELEREQRIAAFADSLVTDLADSERNGSGTGATRLAREFKRALDANDTRAIHKTFASTPSVTLFSATSLTELGVKRARKMHALHDEWMAGR